MRRTFFMMAICAETDDKEVQQREGRAHLVANQVEGVDLGGGLLVAEALGTGLGRPALGTGDDLSDLPRPAVGLALSLSPQPRPTEFLDGVLLARLGVDGGLDEAE